MGPNPAVGPSAAGGCLFGRYTRVHMVGIGGAGMEGLARLLAQLG